MTTTPAARPLPAHGSRSRYSNHGCRCQPCRLAHRRYERERTRQMAYGTWQPYVDAAPVRAHVRALMDQGIGWRRIADLAGLPRATMNRLLYGVPSRGRPPAARVRKATADRLLAVRFAPELLADRALVDATGTWRRIRALVAVGWPQVHIARALGTSGQGLQLHDARVLAGTARKVADLYEAWWNAEPTRHGVSPGQTERARRYAREHGWAPPMAWDDDALDDPDAEPHTADDVRLRAADRLDDVVHLAEGGVAVHEIARRVGISADYARGLLNGYVSPAPIRTG